jgi:transcriptional regulator with XRE-family HTH domain
MNCAEMLKSRRQAVGLTQKQVADALGLTVPTIQSWERGTHTPRLFPNQMQILCETLQVSLEELAVCCNPQS